MLFFGSLREALNPYRDQARDFLERGGHRPRVFAAENLLAFFSSIPTVARLIAEEPEILIFAASQWLVIWLAYLVWTQMLQWISDDLWNAVEHASRQNQKAGFTLINLALLAWSFLVVAVASYPIGLCNAAMVAVHDLRRCGERATLGRCLGIAQRHLNRIWMFTVVDGWITVNAILDRLPRKNHRRTPLDELLYYAWKVATIAVVPALVNGRNFVAAGRDSLSLLTSDPVRALGLRLGYSAICWVVGVLTYAGAVALLCHFGPPRTVPHFLYQAYVLMAVPILVSVGVIAVLVRPFFLLAVAKLYTDRIDVKAEVEADLAAWQEEAPQWRPVWFLAAVLALMVVVYFTDQLGVTQLIRHLADLDLRDLAHLH